MAGAALTIVVKAQLVDSSSSITYYLHDFNRPITYSVKLL